MKRQFRSVLLAIVWPCAGLSGCGVLSSETKSSLGEVDQLLARVESVQVESTVSRERSHAALEILQTLVQPEFDGDAAKTFEGFRSAIEVSEQQAQRLGESVTPMKEAAEDVFRRWTHDLEGIGNTRLRAQSHVRLEETRARYEAVLSAVTTAQVTFDAFNADLRDHALFLGHDFNGAAVSAVRSEVSALAEREKDLDQRLDACDAAARRYVEASALHGQLSTNQPAPAANAAASTPQVAPTQAQPANKPAPKPAAEGAQPKKPVATLPPRPDGQPAPAEPAPVDPPKQR